MTDIFYRNPRLLILTIGLVIVAGLAALQTLPRQEDPAMARRFGNVTTNYPGASAKRVESLITEKIEAELRKLHEIDEISSFSRSGVSMVNIDLADEYSEDDVDVVWSKVRDRIADVAERLPSGAGAPELEDGTSTALSLLVGLTWTQDGEPNLAILNRLAKELESRLRNVAYTRETEILGGAEEEIRVTIDPLALASIGLTAQEVSSRITTADSKVPAGQLRGTTNDLVIEISGELRTVDRIRSIPLRRSSDGRLLNVGDVARVEKTVREPAESIALLGGRRGIAISATMQDAHRVDLWAENAHRTIQDFRAEVPSGIKLDILFDQNSYTSARLGNLVTNLVAGSTIVVAVLLVMMGLRSAILVATALPLTVGLVLAEMSMLGVPLHQMSISGLIIALGLLIDNSIVVVDEMNARIRRGTTPAAAVRETIAHLRIPLAVSTMTTVLAFLPIVLMPGGAGEFVGTIAVSVGLAITSSFALAMTVIPALAGYFPASSGDSGTWWRDGFSSSRLTGLFRRSLHLALRRPVLGIAASLVLPIIGFAVGQTLPEQFFPASDRDQFQVQVVLPAQTSIATTRTEAERARSIIHAHAEVIESHWFIGESTARVYYNLFDTNDGQSSFAGAFVTTRSASATEALLPKLQTELTQAFPRARIVALPFEQGPPFEAPIEVRITGPDLEILRRLGEDVRRVLIETDGVTYTAAKLSGGEPKLVLATDEAEARLADLELVGIARQLDARLEGTVGGSALEGNEELPVRVRVDRGDRQDLPSLTAGRLLAASRSRPSDSTRIGGVPIQAIAKIELVPELAGIARRNGERINTVQGFLEPYKMIAGALADFEQRLEEAHIELPAGYAIGFGGENEQRSEAMGKLAAFALPLFVLMAGGIVLSFGSFRMAGIIFSVAFLSIGLAQLGVWAFGYPMGFIAIVGTMGLVGLAINDAIVVLNALRTDPRAATGETEATSEVVIDAAVHVLATTFTTIGGFLPLIFFGGRFWPPMATAIAGGVGGCSIIALYLVPAVFVRIRRRDSRRAADRILVQTDEPTLSTVGRATAVHVV